MKIQLLFGRRTLLSLMLCSLMSSAVNAQDKPADKPADPTLEPDKGKPVKKATVPAALKEIKDVAGLPRVLLIGDSISIGYTLGVREDLKGKANVHRALENCGPTERGLTNMDEWLGDSHWDVIHFNFGLHDLKYLDKDGKYVPPKNGTVVATPEVYGENLRKIVTRLKKTGAKLIFATTTPVPSGTLGRTKDDDRIYNAKAAEVMKEMDVRIDDLGGYVRELQDKLPAEETKTKGKPAPRPGDIQLPRNVHFTEDGYRQLAGLVAASIEAELPKPENKPAH